MALTITTEPLTEPVTRDEFKAHLRLDTTDDALALAQSIKPGAHVIAADFSLKGAGVNVSGSSTTVFLNAGVFGAGGTVDVKLQESATDVDGDYTDVVGGTFSQVTDATDETTYELAYTGGFTFIRALATVATDTCDFAVSVAEQALTTNENDYLDALLVSARRWCEVFTRRAFIATVFKLTLDRFPTEFTLSNPPATAATIKYYDVNGVQQDLSSSVYDTDFESEPARISLAFGQSWPSIRSMNNAVEVNYTSGYGDDASDVPTAIKQAIMILAAHWYESREPVVVGMSVVNVALSVESILWFYRHLEAV